MIHPTAIIDPDATIAASVSIGAGAVVGAAVRLGAGCSIGPYAILEPGTEIAERVQIGAHAVIGGPPQDLGFDHATPSGVQIGPGSCIREHVTINRSHEENGVTRIGAGAFLMAGSHVGHGSSVGDSAVLANLVMLAGHVQVGAHAFLGGGAGIHQFVRIGACAMVSGLSRISRDVPPFLIVSERDRVNGLNLVGLRRREFSPETIRDIKEAFQAIYRHRGGQRERARVRLATQPPATSQAREFLAFFEAGKRGFAQPATRQERSLKTPSGVNRHEMD